MAHFGLYAERGSAASLAACITALMQNSARARQRGQALRARAVKRYSWDDAARCLVGVYDAIRAPRPELRAAALAQLLEGDHAREPR
jgi:glycosyltransferase involved in cell wall biosynthesis